MAEASPDYVREAAVDVLAEWLPGYWGSDPQVRADLVVLERDFVTIRASVCDPYPLSGKLFRISVKVEEVQVPHG